MNSMTEVIKHLRAAQPHMQAMGDALSSHALPDVPRKTQLIRQISRLDKLVGIADFIGTASLLECKHIINELIDRTSTITGCATDLENASCALTRSIEIDGDAADTLRSYMEARDEA